MYMGMKIDDYERVIKTAFRNKIELIEVILESENIEVTRKYD